MSLVDKLLLVNSPQKINQLEKVKKHKHVVFADAPTIHHFDKKKSPKPPSKPSQDVGKVVVVETTTTTTVDHKKEKPKFRSKAAIPVNLPQAEEKVEVIEVVHEEIKEEEEESSSSSEEVEYVKESVDGVCDFDFCQE